ncbi:MAG: hypothetical protein AB7V42_05350 [Thermoleophilia bacterium]
MNDAEDPSRPTTSLAGPPLDDWERQGALRELARLAWDLQRCEGDAAMARLGRLTHGQRAAVADAMDRILELGG